MVVQFVVFDYGGQSMTIDTTPTVKQMQQMSVKDLKNKIAERYPPGKAGVSASIMKLVFGGERLDESKRLIDYKLNHLSRIQMIITLDGGMAV